MPNLHHWSVYIMQRCLFLSGLLLFVALVFWIHADTDPSLYPVLRHYIQHSQSLSAMVLSAGLVGGLLLEDGLRRRNL